MFDGNHEALTSWDKGIEEVCSDVSTVFLFTFCHVRPFFCLLFTTIVHSYLFLWYFIDLITIISM